MIGDGQYDELYRAAVRDYTEGNSATLTPEQQAQALLLKGQIVEEAKRLLEGKDLDRRSDTEGNPLSLMGQNHIDTVAASFRGAELLIDRYEYQFQGVPSCSRQRLFVFYPDRVDHIIRVSVGFYRVEPGEDIADKSGEKLFRARIQDLSGLLSDVKNSRPRP